MTLRERILEYMKSNHLSRRQMAELVDIKCHNLSKYLDDLLGCSKEATEATLSAYFLKLDKA